MRRHGAKGSRKHKIRMESLAHLYGSPTAARQGENRVARQHRDPRGTDRDEPGCHLFGDTGAQVFFHVMSDGEGHDYQAHDSTGLRAIPAHRADQTISALVDGLDALIRLEPGAQRRQTARHAVPGDVGVAPERVFQLSLSYDLAGMLEEQSKRRQFLWRKMNRLVSPKERAVAIQSEIAEREFRFRRIGALCCRKLHFGHTSNGLVPCRSNAVNAGTIDNTQQQRTRANPLLTSEEKNQSKPGSSVMTAPQSDYRR